jgi:serine/threonine protein kinase
VRNHLIDMLKALHYCNKIIGVVHRDIKPDNIMINKTGEAVLIDFGVSATYSLEDNKNELLNLKAGS